MNWFPGRAFFILPQRRGSRNVERRSLTLIEVMLVLFIIALAVGVLTYNMKGSLNEGKCFKTRQRARQIEQMLQMVSAQTGESLEEIQGHPEESLKKTGLVPNPESFMKDGWNERMRVEIVNDQLIAISEKYRRLMKEKFGPGWTEAKDHE